MSKEEGIKITYGKHVHVIASPKAIAPERKVHQTIYTIGDVSLPLDKIREDLMENIKIKNETVPVISLKNLLDDGNIIEAGKHRVFKDREYYIVEKFEYTDEFGDDMFSVVDAYQDFQKALVTIATL